MDLLFDPALWVGLVTLIVLELVLGIDNLVFIAILAKKLPAAQRDRALYIGLGLAVFLRLALLSVMSWLVGLTEPLFTLFEHPFSLRDLILIAGGVFLLYKSTSELHERLEARPHDAGSNGGAAGFWVVIAQILVLDAVFSLDSIITAVGMVENLYVMMTAVVVAIGVMVLASRPLTQFVNDHPTVVVLCLSFLLMIGLSLVADGFGFHIPKGYLYAAIGFSILIEFFNQVAARSAAKQTEKLPFRQRTLSAIVSLMGRPGERIESDETDDAPAGESFNEEERRMVEGVLTLGERSVKSIMTPRSSIVWINLKRPPEEIEALIRRAPHSCYPVCEGSLEHVVGIIKVKDFAGVPFDPQQALAAARRRPVTVVPETVDVIGLMRGARRGLCSLVLVADEFGVIQGLVTTHDLLEAIAGDFPDENERGLIESLPEGRGWSADGAAELLQVEQATGVPGLRSEAEDAATLAGLLLLQFGRIPARGETVEVKGLRFTVSAAEKNRIERVTITRAR